MYTLKILYKAQAKHTVFTRRINMSARKFEKPKSLDEFIDKGAPVSSDVSQNCAKEWTNFTLRIRKDLSQKIDNTIENRIGITKTAWILEAIQEKLMSKS